MEDWLKEMQYKYLQYADRASAKATYAYIVGCDVEARYWLNRAHTYLLISDMCAGDCR